MTAQERVENGTYYEGMTYDEVFETGKLVANLNAPEGDGWHVYACPNPYDKWKNSVVLWQLNHLEQECRLFPS